jgi:hypothetical protein
LAPFRLELLGLSTAAIIGVVVLNRELYKFFFRQQGFLFAAACVPLHLLYYLYSGLSYLGVWMNLQLGGATAYLRRSSAE